MVESKPSLLMRPQSYQISPIRSSLPTSFTLNHLLKSLSPDTVTLGLGLQHMNLGDTVQSVAGSPRERECVRADAAQGGWRSWSRYVRGSQRINAEELPKIKDRHIFRAENTSLGQNLKWRSVLDTHHFQRERESLKLPQKRQRRLTAAL